MGTTTLRRHREGLREPVPVRKSTEQLLAEARAKEIELLKEVGRLRLELDKATPPEALAALAQATERVGELEQTNEQLVAGKARLTNELARVNEQNTQLSAQVAQLNADAKRLTDELTEAHELLESLTAEPVTPEPAKPETTPASPRGRRKRRVRNE